MQQTVNESFVATRSRLGGLSMIAGFVVLVVGFVISLSAPTRPELLAVPWITLGVAVFLLNLGKFYQSRYGLRPDRLLLQSLKGLDGKYHLFSFVKEIPTEHVLLTPNGVVVLELRPFTGDVINEGDKWSRPVNPSGILHLFSDGSLGNPTKDAAQDVTAVRKVLRERLGDQVADAVPMAAIIVFTNPRVKLQVSEPAVPVVLLSDLRGELRKLRDGTRMPLDLQKKLARALEASQNQADDALSTSRSKSWQRTQKSTPK